MKAHYNHEKFTVNERKGASMEIKRQLAEYEAKHSEEFVCAILWVLHKEFGFGEKRLRRFYDSFFPEVDKLLERYELEDDDRTFICRQMLKRDGIDISSWERIYEKK